MNLTQNRGIARVQLPEYRGYDVHFCPLDDLPDLMESAGLTGSKCIVVSDANVATLYMDRVCTGLRRVHSGLLQIVLPAGESTKSPESLKEIYEQALGWKISRKTPLVALGGGVIGDIAGFAAATLLRGIPLVHVPTTMISQVDSSIGGKTGLNHDYGKNLIGSFYQPRFVCTDTETLMTLPEREWTSGLAEAFKHAIIADEDFFSWIENHTDRIISRDQEFTRGLIQRAAEIKCRVVSEDELESGLRMILNFGHTFAHALERSLGYGVLTHGEAVTLGMRAALVLSRSSCPEIELERADRVLSLLPVPHVPSTINIDKLSDSMTTDKKRTAAGLQFVILERLGRAITTSDINDADVRDAWQRVLSE